MSLYYNPEYVFPSQRRMMTSPTEWQLKFPCVHVSHTCISFRMSRRAISRRRKCSGSALKMANFISRDFGFSHLLLHSLQLLPPLATLALFPSLCQPTPPPPLPLPVALSVASIVYVSRALSAAAFYKLGMDGGGRRDGTPIRSAGLRMLLALSPSRLLLLVPSESRTS